MGEVVTVATQDGIGVVSIDSPPVNALGIAVRKGLDAAIDKLTADAGVQAIVIIGAGKVFSAGADITEFGKPLAEPGLHTVFTKIDDSPKPVVAAISGVALGGGLELALACHYRVAVPSAKLGLPEVKLGLLPGAGGTQRLPRIVGVQAALQVMTGGDPVGAKQALQTGVIDALAEEGRLKDDAIAFARKVQGQPPVRVRDRDDKLEEARANPQIFDDFRKANARAFKGFKAPENIVKAVEAAVKLPFDDGLRREQELFQELMDSTESQAQRYVFFAERDTSKIPDVPSDTPTLDIKTVGVLGAGTMGGGITINFLNAGIPVHLLETSQEALDRGVGVIRKTYEISVNRGRLTAEQLEQRMALLRPTLKMEDLANVDLVIEAVFESMPLKKEIFGKLDQTIRQGAILASNTSFLDIDEIAACTKRPEFVVGLHFFSPANVMRLLEVVRGERTSKEVIATAMKLAKAIAKVPVLSRVCHGFIANRMMSLRGLQANSLVLQGPTPAEIDKASTDYGFAMGPFAMMDLVGLDVTGRDTDERTLYTGFVERDRLGQKKNGGFYDYDEQRKAQPSPVAAEIIAEFAKFKGVKPTGPMDAETILAKLLYPVVNEGVKLLEEGIALRASDIDMAIILGYNWPVYTGGPMFWADTVGLPKIVAGLKAMQAEQGDVVKPAALLEKLATEGGSLTGAR